MKEMSRLEESREMIKSFYAEYESNHPMFTDEDISLLSWLIRQAEETKELQEKNEYLEKEIESLRLELRVRGM